MAKRIHTIWYTVCSYWGKFRLIVDSFIIMSLAAKHNFRIFLFPFSLIKNHINSAQIYEHTHTANMMNRTYLLRWKIASHILKIHRAYAYVCIVDAQTIYSLRDLMKTHASLRSWFWFQGNFNILCMMIMMVITSHHLLYYYYSTTSTTTKMIL